MARQPVRYWLIAHSDGQLPAMGLSRELNGRWTVHPNLAAALTKSEAKQWLDLCTQAASIVRCRPRPFTSFAEYMEAHVEA